MLTFHQDLNNSSLQVGKSTGAYALHVSIWMPLPQLSGLARHRLTTCFSADIKVYWPPCSKSDKPLEIGGRTTRTWLVIGRIKVVSLGKSLIRIWKFVIRKVIDLLLEVMGLILDFLAWNITLLIASLNIVECCRSQGSSQYLGRLHGVKPGEGNGADSGLEDRSI